jgi:hypothetical protein
MVPEQLATSKTVSFLFHTQDHITDSPPLYSFLYTSQSECHNAACSLDTIEGKSLPTQAPNTAHSVLDHDLTTMPAQVSNVTGTSS